MLRRFKKVIAILLATMLILSGIMPSYQGVVYADEIEESTPEEVEVESVATEESEDLDPPLEEGVPLEEEIEEAPSEEVESVSEENLPEEVIEPISEEDEENENLIEKEEEVFLEEEVLPEEETEENELQPENEENLEVSEEETVESEDSPATDEEIKDEEISSEDSELTQESVVIEEKEEDASVFSYVSLFEVFPVNENTVLGYPLSKTAVLTSGFGYRTPLVVPSGLSSTDHTGIDLAISLGTPVLAAEKGTVTVAEWRKGYGNCVFITHENGFETRYAHLSEVNVKPGESVVKGQQIGRVGSTGDSTGPHLHFEVLKDGVNVDPEPYITEGSLPMIDFSSKRLIVMAKAEDLPGEPIIGSLGDLVLIQYETEEEVKAAFLRLIKSFDSVEVDSVIGVATDEVEGEPTDYMTEEENPFTAAESVSVDKIRYDIAVIDTGANNADKIVSVLGDNGSDNHGHGQKMIDIIKVLSPNARVLSIKAIGDEGVGDISSVYSAMLLAMESNVKVINLSISAIKTENSFIIEQAIKDATEKGIMVVGSAGNNGADASLFVPAGVEEAIVVGAKDVNGDILATSNRGSTVDLYVVSRSTSTAAAMVSAYLVDHSDLSEIDSFLASIIPAERLVDIEFIKGNADDKVSTSNLSPIGFVHSIITFATDEVNSIDELWEDEETAVDKYKGFIHGYVLVYNGSETDDYAVARLIEPNDYKGLVFKDYITARDNNKGEVIEGCIYDSETGLLYIPKSLLTLTEGEHQLNEVRVQLLYTGTLSSAQENEFVIQRIPTNMNAYHCADGASKAKASAHPTKSATVVVDRAAGFKSGTYSEDYYTYQGGEIYFSDSLSEQYNSKGNLSYMIVNGEIDGFPYTIRELDTAIWSASWEVELGEGTWELSDGTTVEFPGGTFYLVCNHVGISDTYDYFDDVYNNPGGVTVDSAYIRILEVDEEEQMMYCGLIVPSRHTQSGAAIFKMPYDVDQTGYATLTKTSADTSLTNGNPCYNMDGIKYNVFVNTGTASSPVKGDLKGTVTLSNYDVATSTATSDTIELTPGEYVLQEDESSTVGTGYKYSDKLYAVTVVSTETAEVTAKDVPLNDPDRLSINKANDVAGNPRITHESATFKVEFFANDSWGGSATRTWYYKTINGKLTLGNTDYIDSSYNNSENYYEGSRVVFPLGTIRVTEEKAPKGYNSSDFVLEGKVSLNASGEVEFTWTSTAVSNKLKYESDGSPSILDEQQYGTGEVIKEDEETGSSTQGNAQFTGIRFAIINRSGRSVYVNNTERANGTVVSILSVGTNGKASTGKVLPFGTYEVIELRKDATIEVGEAYDSSTKLGTSIYATYGYLWSGVKKSFEIKQDSEVKSLTFTDRIVRGDVNFSKIDIDGSKMANIPFLISRLDNDGNIVESHVIVTDLQGNLNTATRPKTGAKVNSLDEYVSNGVFTDESKLDGTTGVWFGEQSAREAGRGSLIYANYLIQELKTSSNTGHDTLEQFMIGEDEDIKTLFTEGKNFALNNLFVDLEVLPESDLLDVTTGTKVSTISEETKLEDSVRWHHLKVGQEYKLKTVIYYEAPEGGITLLGENTIPFTPAKPSGISTETVNGITKNTVTVNTLGLNGGKIHAIDYIYAVNNGKDVLLVTHNEDMNDERQSVSVPRVGTTATDKNTGSHVGTPVENAMIDDVVTYENFPDRGTFIVEGTLRFADTGEAIGTVKTLLNTDKRLTEVTVDSDGTVNGPLSGQFTMPTFNFDASTFEGRTVVVTEVFIDKITKQLFAEHYDLTDEDQSVHYVKVETIAKDEATGNHTGAVIEEDRVIDEVKLYNLVPGEEYTVKGKYVKKDDLTLLSTSEPYTFVASASEESVFITFLLDSRELSGFSAVAFEYVYNHDVEVGKHEDPEDSDQTINYPSVKTTAKDLLTGGKAGAIGETGIVDGVELSNLTVGEKYRVIGTVHNEDGSSYEVDGEVLTVLSDVFTAEEKDMNVELTFELDSTELAGTKKVVFETLFSVNEEGEETGVARHEDPEDEDQTIYYPSGKTTAKDKKTGTKDVFAEEEAEVIDTFKYELLPPGEYEMEAELYSIEKDETVVKKTFTFTVTELSGSLDVPFFFNSLIRKDEHLVVFETVKSGGIPVIIHRDPEDKDQTVYVPYEVKIGTVATDKADGDKFIKAEEGQEITDKIGYELKPNAQHTAVLTVFDKTEGKLIEGIEIRKVFTTSKTGVGEVGVEVTLDGTSISGHLIVMFEKVYEGEYPEGDLPEEPVATHEDPDDVDQTIGVPEIRTIIKDSKSGTNVVSPYWVNDVLDTVIYKGLIPNLEYTLEGVFISKVDGTETEITGTITFTPEDADGEIDVPFSFDGTKVEGTEYVAFETLFHNDKPIAEHKDLEDEDQLVKISPIGTIDVDKDIPLPVTPGREYRNPTTGDTSNIVLWFILFIVSVAFAVYSGVKLKRGKRG